MTGLDPLPPVAEMVRRRVTGDFEVDPWGLDPEFHDTAVRLGRLRWRVGVDGLAHLPTTGPALLLIQRRLGLSEGAVVATGIRLASDRRVRSAGVPGVRWFEATMRRTGAAFAHPDEISGLLRDGHVVALGLRTAPLGGRPGAVDPDLVVPALALDAPVIPVAVHGNELARRWTLVLAPPVELTHDGGRLAAIEHVERARDAIHAHRPSRMR